MTTTEGYYDTFATHLLHDYVHGNLRVQRQLEFFRNAIPASAESVLVVGCGSGEGVRFLAKQVAPRARILAIDLSGENIRIANALFRQERVSYRQADITLDQLEGGWQFILLPDVYEHIPVAGRTGLHSRLRSLLTRDGRVLLTIPSIYHQRTLQAAGKGLQIVDELVSLDDLAKLAVDLGGALTYFCAVSVWRANDYVHAIIEVDADRYALMSKDEWLPVKGCPRRSLGTRAWGRLARNLGLGRLRKLWRVTRVQRTLQRGETIRRQL